MNIIVSTKDGFRAPKYGEHQVLTESAGNYAHGKTYSARVRNALKMHRTEAAERARQDPPPSDHTQKFPCTEIFMSWEPGDVLCEGKGDTTLTDAVDEAVALLGMGNLSYTALSTLNHPPSARTQVHILVNHATPHFAEEVPRPSREDTDGLIEHLNKAFGWGDHWRGPHGSHAVNTEFPIDRSVERIQKCRAWLHKEIDATKLGQPFGTIRCLADIPVDIRDSFVTYMQDWGHHSTVDAFIQDPMGQYDLRSKAHHYIAQSYQCVLKHEAPRHFEYMDRAIEMCGRAKARGLGEQAKEQSQTPTRYSRLDSPRSR